MVPVARRNLFAEKGRFAMSVCGVAFAVLLILIVVSLYRGWSTTGSVYLDLPGNLWVAQAGTIDPFHSTSMLPAGKASQLHGIPGVVAAFPVYARHIAFPTRGGGRIDAYAMAIQVPAGAPVPPLARRFLPAPGHVAVDEVFAGQAGVAVRRPARRARTRAAVDPLLPGGNKIVEFAFLNPADTRVLLGAPGYVSYYLLTTAPGAGLGAVARRIDALIPGAETHTSADFAGAFNRMVSSGFLSVVEALVGIGFVVGAAVIALTTYTATVEKARDYSVLKAIGAS